MGNTESGPEGPFGPVGSLKHRLQSLEETIQSIEVWVFATERGQGVPPLPFYEDI